MKLLSDKTLQIREALSRHLGFEPLMHSPQAGVLAISFSLSPLSERVFKQAELFLNSNEKKRVTRLSGQARHSFLASRSCLRIALGAWTETSPQELPLVSEPGKKPHLTHPEFQFSLSHSGDWCALGLAEIQAIGIDIECEKPLPKASQIAERFFHFNETESLKTTPEVRSQIDFQRLWTAKEAILKCRGLAVPGGLSHDEARIRPDLSIHPVSTEMKLFELSIHPKVFGHMALQLN